MSTTHDYDVVIIGSGAGGGTVAARLAPLVKAGAKIALLESGPHYTRDYFTQREIEMMGLLWQGGAWPTKDGAITLATGKGVGGSTMMYTGVTFRLPEEVYAEWNVPGVTQEDLAPRFDRLEEEIHVKTPGAEMANDNNRLFREGCEKLGYDLEELQINIDQCKQYGFCNVGCASGGKQSTLEVQIPHATAEGVELIPNCHVKRLGERTVEAEVGEAPPNTHAGPWAPGTHTIRAKRVVVAAGTPGSPALLLRSGLGETFPALGTHFTLHPALTVYGVYPEVIKNYRGFPKTYFTPEFSKSHHYYIETAFYYPFVSTKHLGLWGQDLKDLMKAYPRFMTQIILNHDKARSENRVTIDDKGTPVLDYTLTEDSVASLCHAQASAARIFFAAGCEKVVMPCADRPVFGKDEVADDQLETFIHPGNFLRNKMPIASAHPQGGCRMGTDPATSVTNEFGQVHDMPWLHVADASLFPTSSHVNPYLTIMALADRVAEHLTATKDEW
jgi:choline dehydrogenase-like flavoprotein